jgi:hypothetical protein
VVVGVSPLVFVGFDESGEVASPAGGGGEPVLSDPEAAFELVLVDSELVGAGRCLHRFPSDLLRTLCCEDPASTASGSGTVMALLEVRAACR